MKISIITVCWNSEKFISDAMQSVLDQDYTDIEYIIVDGASTDRTLEHIRKYQSKFGDRMKWISEKDKGIVLWKWFIIGALLFLALEALLLRFYKP